MNYRHLQFFVAVVQQGSLKAAARDLGVSQPALSAAIRNLEREFGARLLDRRRDGSVPTPYGSALYESAVTLGKVVENARSRIATLKDPTRQHLRIGTGPSVPGPPVAKAVAGLLGSFPGLRVDVVTAEDHAVLEQKLVVQEIDLALCHVPPARMPAALECHRVGDNTIGALVASAQVPAGVRSITQREMLTGFRWITSRDDEIRRPEGLAFGPSDPSRDQSPITVVAEDLELIKTLTLTTRSVGFLPLHMAAAELGSGELLQLVARGVRMDRPIYALRRPGREADTVADRFIEAITGSFHLPAGRVRRTVEVVG